MHRKSRPKAIPHMQPPPGQPFTAAGVRLTPGVSSPVYAYGTCGLQPAERVAEGVMRLNAQLAQAVRETDATYTIADLDQRFQLLLHQLEDTGICRRDTPCPPIITKAQWLQAQWATIQKLAKGEKL